MSSVLLALLLSPAFANTSTATIQLQGVVPRILKQSVNPDNTITILHNFPIELQYGCVRINDTEMKCQSNVTIVTVE